MQPFKPATTGHFARFKSLVDILAASRGKSYPKTGRFSKRIGPRPAVVLPEDGYRPELNIPTTLKEFLRINKIAHKSHCKSMVRGYSLWPRADRLPYYKMKYAHQKWRSIMAKRYVAGSDKAYVKVQPDWVVNFLTFSYYIQNLLWNNKIYKESYGQCSYCLKLIDKTIGWYAGNIVVHIKKNNGGSYV